MVSRPVFSATHSARLEAFVNIEERKMRQEEEGQQQQSGSDIGGSRDASPARARTRKRGKTIVAPQPPVAGVAASGAAREQVTEAVAHAHGGHGEVSGLVDLPSFPHTLPVADDTATPSTTQAAQPSRKVHFQSKLKELSMAPRTHWWISLWFIVTVPVIFWDVGYCFMRYVTPSLSSLVNQCYL
jgi:hypothetical protein